MARVERRQSGEGRAIGLLESRSGAFLLLFSSAPANSCTPDYVVIGLFLEPIDALLQYHLRFPIVCLFLRGALNRVELLRNRFCSRCLVQHCYSCSRSQWNPCEISVIYLNPPWNSYTSASQHNYSFPPVHHVASSLLASSHHPALSCPPPTHPLLQFLCLPHPRKKHSLKP